MQIRGRGLRFASMVVVVVLALTGFSTGRGGRGSSGDGGGSGGSGGGGCSSSRQDHDSSSSSSGGYRDDDYDDDDDDYGSGSGSGGSYDDGYGDPYGDPPTDGGSTSAGQVEPAVVKLVKCATVKEPYATVEVTNPHAVDAEFWVAVSFKDRSGRTMVLGSWRPAARGDWNRCEDADTRGVDA